MGSGDPSDLGPLKNRQAKVLNLTQGLAFHQRKTPERAVPSRALHHRSTFSSGDGAELQRFQLLRLVLQRDLRDSAVVVEPGIERV